MRRKAAVIVIYAAVLRVSEIVNLKVQDIDSKRMQIHIELGKGKKDRYALLSEKNLETGKQNSREEFISSKGLQF
jgi:integrase/recombinase XerD